MLAALLFAPLALAEDPAFQEHAEPGQKFDTPETELSVELGGALATGNVDYYTLNGLLNGSHRSGRNQVALQGGVNIGKGVLDADEDGLLSDEERSAGKVEIARKFWGEGRYDRFLTEKGSLYLLVGALGDRYAGYDLRVHEQLGYSRILVENDTTDLKAELGADVAHEFYVAGIRPDQANIYAVRLMLGIEHRFHENLVFADEVELYENVLDPADMRLLNTASISARLSRVFSLKLSNSLTFDNVPVEGYRKLDQTTLVSLVATLK